MLSKPCHELGVAQFCVVSAVSSASFEHQHVLTKASFIITWKVYSLGYVIFGGDFSALDVLI